MNRKEMRAYLTEAAKNAKIVDNVLFVKMLGEYHPIAELNPKWKKHGITIRQLLKEYVLQRLEKEKSESTSGQEGDEAP